MEFYTKLTATHSSVSIKYNAANAAIRHGEDGNPLVLET